jgi:hypothetical protein
MEFIEFLIKPFGLWIPLIIIFNIIYNFLYTNNLIIGAILHNFYSSNKLNNNN